MSSKLIKLYFKHDYGARNDPKLIKVKRKFGFEGIGIYWCLVEVLYENKGKITFDELEDFCYDKGCPIDKAKEVCSIAFNISKNIITSSRIEKELIQQNEISIKRSAAATKRYQKKVIEEPEWMKNGNKPAANLTEEEKKEADELINRLLGKQ